MGIDATLLLVRTLEDQSKVFEAAKLLKDLIAHIFSSSDVALVYYRLAYMEWKLGRSDLCAACYQMAIIIGGSVAQPAKEELEDLLKADASVKKLDTPQEVFSFLKQNGVPVFDQKAVQLLLAAHVLTMAFIVLAKTCSRTALKLPLTMQLPR